MVVIRTTSIANFQLPISNWQWTCRIPLSPFPPFPFSPFPARWLSGLLAFLFLFVPLSSMVQAQKAPVSEYEVKAALLLNFVRFSEWPVTAFADAKSPYVVGVIGSDPFGKELEKAFENKVVKGRSFLLKRISIEQEMRNCHLLFVTASERRRWRDLREKLKGAPVLTVGESSDFIGQGGIINFLLKDNSVRFEINLEAAQAARLKLDANLLKVAVSVKGKYE